MSSGRDESLRRLVRVVDGLEAASEGYLELDAVRDAADAASVQAALADDLLLVDRRTRLAADTGEPTPVTVCRLNRRHPLVRELLSW